MVESDAVGAVGWSGEWVGGGDGARTGNRMTMATPRALAGLPPAAGGGE